jgi:hypothetical protein
MLGHRQSSVFLVGAKGLVGIRVNLNLTLGRQFVDKISQQVTNRSVVASLNLHLD